ncbi:MAG TPA: DUF4249 family protein, partial [Cyclobacteriaceae bacterium]|nr:DUF4249 family protein [Cyclobacteriaceae bacterium]
YKWDFYSHWIFIAPIPPLFSPVKKCWVKNPYYLSDYTLQEDYKGGYDKNLFFVETLQNERILEDLTVLIRQEIVSKDYFFFLKELQDRDQGSLQSDRPPYNLKTNINSSNGEKSVVGYFAVINEQARRWYFNRNDLSYNVANTLRSTCIPNSPGPFVPPPGCNSCLEYTGGEPSTVEPSWWRN